jgi:hypothetical protein
MREAKRTMELLENRNYEIGKWRGEEGKEEQ